MVSLEWTQTLLCHAAAAGNGLQEPACTGGGCPDPPPRVHLPLGAGERAGRGQLCPRPCSGGTRPLEQRRHFRAQTRTVRALIGGSADGSCAQRFAVEFYTFVMLLTFILIIITIPSPLTLLFQA